MPSLTEEQHGYAVQVISTALSPEDGAALVLEGPAGTGKTTVLTWIVLALSHLERPAAVCAPTHKAASVLRGKLFQWDKHFDITDPSTVHSLLCLRMRRGANGGPKEAYQYKEPDLRGYSLVIVDECSMIGSQLYEVIRQGCEAAGLPVLFAGDPCQLQPVDEKGRSRTFGVAGRMELTKVLRHDGAILDLATKIRRLGFVPVVKPAAGDSSEVRIHAGRQAMVDDWLETLRTTESPENVVMLTYTNKERREFNLMARRALMGEDVPRFVSGDVVMALEPVMRDDEVLYQNNEDISIAHATYLPALEPIEGLGATFAVWELKTESLLPIYVLDDKEIDRFESTLKAVRQQVKANVKAAEQKVQRARGTGFGVREAELELASAKAGWSTFYFPLEEFFAQVDFRYSMTIHKSQGSEWPVVYVNDDYTKSRSEDVQLLYVAATRASHQLNHVDNSPRRRS